MKMNLIKANLLDNINFVYWCYSAIKKKKKKKKKKINFEKISEYLKIVVSISRIF